MVEFNKLVGYRISLCRTDAGMTQGDLAAALGTSRNQISYFEIGQRKPTIDQIVKMAELFNVTADYLLCITDLATNDAELISVCKYLQLSEEAVAGLKNRKMYLPSNFEEQNNYLLNRLIVDILPMLNHKILEYWQYCSEDEPRVLHVLEEKSAKMACGLSENRNTPNDVSTCGSLQYELSMAEGIRKGKLYDIPAQLLGCINKLIGISSLEKREWELQKIIGVCCEQSLAFESEKEGVPDGQYHEED